MVAHNALESSTPIGSMSGKLYTTLSLHKCHIKRNKCGFMQLMIHFKDLE